MRANEFLIENVLNEGVELPYKGYVIKAFTLKNSNTAKAWVGDRNGNQVTNITKLFPEVEVGSEEEAVAIQKQKIDDYTNANSVVTKYFKTYPNKNLQSILHLPDYIYAGVDSGGIVYISTKPQPGWLKKSVTYADGSGTGTPIHIDDLKKAGLEPGTRYEVISKEVMDPDTVALKVKEYNRITHSGDKDDNRVPLIVIQMAGRNKSVAEAANPAQQAAIAISKKEEVDEDWQKVNKKDKTDGMSGKAVKAYRRENPGSKLKTAVTTKPSKLKKGSKSAKRRKSFCARMSGMKKAHASAKTKRDPDSPINKALRRWNCESVQQMEKLVMIAEHKIRNLKK